MSVGNGKRTLGVPSARWGRQGGGGGKGKGSVAVLKGVVGSGGRPRSKELSLVGAAGKHGGKHSQRKAYLPR